MARDGSGTYSLPAGSTVTNGDVSDSSDINTPLQDIETDLNTARPIVAGGTGATTAADARTNLGVGAAQTVTFAALKTGDGSVSAPGYNFTNDADTGMYLDSGLAFAFAGTERVKITAAATAVSNQVRVADGSSSLPSYSFSGDTDTGLYKNSTTGLDFVWGGTRLLQLQADGDIEAPGIYAKTTASAANVLVDSNGVLYRSTSGRKYKTDVQPYDRGVDDLAKLAPVTFKSATDPDGPTYAGFIAEDVHDAGLTEFVAYDRDGNPDAIHYANMVALLVKVIQDQDARIKALEAR